ncbi:hypothetical protein MD484_g2613, partial [Candolleomyces efflorescens]
MCRELLCRLKSLNEFMENEAATSPDLLEGSVKLKAHKRHIYEAYQAAEAVQGQISAYMGQYQV